MLSQLRPEDLADHTASLAGRLEDPAAAVRSAAVHTMEKLDKEVLEKHLPQVVGRLSDEDKDVRSAAVGTLFHKLEVTELASHVEKIVERIEDDDVGVRRSTALWARSKLDPNLLGKHSAAIAGGLDDPILSVRRASLEALALTDPTVLTKYAPLIVQRLSDEILSVRRAAVAALQRLYPSDLIPHTTALTQALRDPEWTVRAAIVEALGKLPMEHLAAHVVSPHMLDAMEDAFDGVRSAAVGVLGGLRPAVLREHADAIAAKMQHQRPAVKIAAITVLDSLDAATIKNYVKELNKRLEPPGDSNKFVRAGALAVLAKCDTEVLAPHANIYFHYIDDHDEMVASTAWDALTKADPGGKLLAESPTKVVRNDSSQQNALVSPMRKQGSMAALMSASTSSLQISSPSLKKDLRHRPGGGSNNPSSRPGGSNESSNKPSKRLSQLMGGAPAESPPMRKSYS